MHLLYIVLYNSTPYKQSKSDRNDKRTIGTQAGSHILMFNANVFKIL